MNNYFSLPTGYYESLNKIKASLNCSVVKIRFTLEALATGQLPESASSIFRGMIGKFLKEKNCINRGVSCDRCPFITGCAYGSIFEPTSEAFAPMYKEKMHNLSPAIVIDGPYFPEYEWREKEEAVLDLLFIGDSAMKIHHFGEVLEEIGLVGVGKHRVKYRIKEVKQIFRNGSTVSLYENEFIDYGNIRLEDLTWSDDDDKEKMDSILIRLETPLRLKFQGEYMNTVTVESFILACLRRAEYVLNIHHGKDLNFESAFVEAVLDGLRISQPQIQWKDFHRYSSRQKRVMNLGGMVGTFELTGNVAAVLPSLEFCSYFHIGKQTVFGCGKFSIWVRK